MIEGLPKPNLAAEDAPEMILEVLETSGQKANSCQTVAEEVQERAFSDVGKKDDERIRKTLFLSADI